jgi:YfiR/HmsC-like
MRVLRLIVVAVALLAPGAARAEFEHEVKAAFLFRFLSYVEWPENAFLDARAPIVVGVLGADEVEVALAAMVAERTAQGRAIEVRRLNGGEPSKGLHMLFVGPGADVDLARLARQSGLLVVSDVKGSIDRGAMISLVRVGNNVRFQVAPEAAERSGLRISSRMLSVAQLVKPGRP